MPSGAKIRFTQSERFQILGEFLPGSLASVLKDPSTGGTPLFRLPTFPVKFLQVGEGFLLHIVILTPTQSFTQFFASPGTRKRSRGLGESEGTWNEAEAVAGRHAGRRADIYMLKTGPPG
jgi:hypothetical protein